MHMLHHGGYPRVVTVAGMVLYVGMAAAHAQQPANAARPSGTGPCAVAGRVADVRDHPIASAHIEVVGSVRPVVLSDASGRYCMPPLDRIDRVTLLASADGHQAQVSPPIDVRPSTTARVDFVLPAIFSEAVAVTGRAQSLVGVSASASEGTVGAAELRARPLLRSTDMMEAVPGVAMTQHSTGGHAPIILLRGYNLDHGTDFATSFAGVPLNLPSHAHAQGYTDTNFLITDLIGRIDFQKGPYAAASGDFGTAGSADLDLLPAIDRPFVTLEAGPYAFYHGVAGGSVARGNTRWLYGAEANHYDGPSVVPDDFNRVKGILRYARDLARGSYDLTAASYGAAWNASDGYPARAVARGHITRFGTLDATDGGSTERHLIVGRWHTANARTSTRVTAYAQYYDFDLFSNLTFWTRDSQLGDQIEQVEHRVTSGIQASQTRAYQWRGRVSELTAGVQVRNDLIHGSLFNTFERRPSDKHDDAGRRYPAQVYDNHITETGLFPYLEARVHWTPWLRTVMGVRADLFRTSVESDTPVNSGSRNAGLVSPKASVVLGPWAHTELYANAGRGFHSNHANGIVQRVDPATQSPTLPDGRPVTPTAPLVKTFGAEVGVRTLRISRLQSSLSAWMIDSDSELVYAPEDGFTQPERPGRRFGVEWNNFYRPSPWLAVDVDAAWSNARYRTDPDREGRLIPDAIAGVVSAGLTLGGVGRFSGSLRGRYLGRRALVPDGTAFSTPSFVMNGNADIRLTGRWSIGIGGFNLLNRRYEDITYYFDTRIRDPRPGGALESSTAPDYVTHPGEPRTVRLQLRLRL